MAQIDWNKPTSDLPKPGTYRVEVKAAVEKRSSGGNNMFVVELVNLDRNRKSVTKDNIMLEGGAWFLGKEKLRALGVDMQKSTLDASELIGKRAYVAIVQGSFEGRDGLVYKAEVNVDATQPKGGYWPETEPPPSYVPAEMAALDDSSVPF